MAIDLPGYISRERKFMLSERTVVPPTGGNSRIGYLPCICIEEDLADIAHEAGCKEGEIVDYIILVKKRVISSSKDSFAHE
jgi:hypothetical protein